jgi:hypothetical protein
METQLRATRKRNGQDFIHFKKKSPVYHYYLIYTIAIRVLALLFALQLVNIYTIATKILMFSVKLCHCSVSGPHDSIRWNRSKVDFTQQVVSLTSL